MINGPFAETTPLAEGFRLDRMKAEHIPAVASIMMSSEPWNSYGYVEDQLERFLAGSIEAGVARVLVRSKSDNPGDAPADSVEGVVIVHPGFLGGRYLEILAVEEKVRGRGLGSMIVEEVCREAPPYVRDVFVLIAVSNVGAARFYSSLGFQAVGELPGLVLPDKVERLLWLRFRN